jgi:hypothetical protein
MIIYQFFIELVSLSPKSGPISATEWDIQMAP